MYIDQVIEELTKIERLHPVAEVVAERPADEADGEVEFEVSQVRWDAQAKKVVSKFTERNENEHGSI